MKKFLLSLFLCASVFVSAQTDTTILIRPLQVQDPTQLFSSVGVGLRVNFEISSFGSLNNIMPELVFGGSLRIKKLQFDMQLPVGAGGNLRTLAGDINLRTAYQIHNNSKGFYKSTLIYAGMQLPTGSDPEDFEDQYSFENLSRVGHFKFTLGGIGSIQVNKRFSIFPSAEIYYKATPIQTTSAINTTDSCIDPPRAAEYGLNFGANFSWIFRKGSFIQFTPSYGFGTRKSISTCSYRDFLAVKPVQKVSLNLKYQHRMTRNAYLTMDVFYHGTSVKDYKQTFGMPNMANLSNIGFMFGFKFYLD